MLFLSVFELYSRWVPLRNVIYEAYEVWDLRERCSCNETDFGNNNIIMIKK